MRNLHRVPGFPSSQTGGRAGMWIKLLTVYHYNIGSGSVKELNMCCVYCFGCLCSPRDKLRTAMAFSPSKGKMSVWILKIHGQGLKIHLS